ncbi:MAG: tyrosine-protein phosphatase [Gammaproteobacteria bacterium]|nr:tyrosine-protein phosphatase [Gammaproteobacteria bacterium]MDH5171581.1 tyrosine-protein phosphatase [Gammaproteobacteria bacterium]
MFDLSACHVERNRDGNYLVRWHLSKPGQKVAVYMADSPDRYYAGSDLGTPIAWTTQTEVLVPNPDKEVRHYFYLESAGGEGVILAERQLNLQGTPNFRDLGGYEARDGRRLKWGKLYRSSKLSALTDVDTRYVHRLGLTLICDFRQVVEQQLEPTRLGSESLHVLASLPVTPGSSHSFIENLHNGIIAVEDAAGFMEEINRDFVINQMPQYAEMFQLLLAGDQQLLIHCASGKDRTGVGAALILDVLGVSEETIVNDYLLTNKYLPINEEVKRLSREFKDRTGAAVSEEVLRPMLELRPEYIRACFDEIKKRYESREHFYESALRLDKLKLDKLKDRYLH